VTGYISPNLCHACGDYLVQRNCDTLMNSMNTALQSAIHKKIDMNLTSLSVYKLVTIFPIH